MHSFIYQISEQPISEDEYISEFEFREGYSHILDYVDEHISENDVERALENLKCNLRGLCEVNGRELTTLDVKPFQAEFIGSIKKTADEISCEDIWKLECMLKQTHRMCKSLFYTDNWAAHAEFLFDFMDYISYLGPGKKLYVGAILDFHW